MKTGRTLFFSKQECMLNLSLVMPRAFTFTVAVTGRGRALVTRLAVIEFINFHNGIKYGAGVKLLLNIPRALRSGKVVSPK